jgi:hypothetical protein
LRHQIEAKPLRGLCSATPMPTKRIRKNEITTGTTIAVAPPRIIGAANLCRTFRGCRFSVEMAQRVLFVAGAVKARAHDLHP